jgi:hypothetical protein
VLSEFRDRLLASGAEERLLQLVLEAARSLGMPEDDEEQAP